MFFNSTLIKQKGIEPIHFGLVGNASEPIDRTLSSGFVDHLFERNGFPGLDLAAVQRPWSTRLERVWEILWAFERKDI